MPLYASPIQRTNNVHPLKGIFKIVEKSKCLHKTSHSIPNDNLFAFIWMVNKVSIQWHVYTRISQKTALYNAQQNGNEVSWDAFHNQMNLILIKLECFAARLQSVARRRNEQKIVKKKTQQPVLVGVFFVHAIFYNLLQFIQGRRDWMKNPDKVLYALVASFEFFYERKKERASQTIEAELNVYRVFFFG